MSSFPFLPQVNTVISKKIDALKLMGFFPSGEFSFFTMSSKFLKMSLQNLFKKSVRPAQEQQKCVPTGNLHFLSLSTLSPTASSAAALLSLQPLLGDDQGTLPHHHSSRERCIHFSFSYTGSRVHLLLQQTP